MNWSVNASREILRLACQQAGIEYTRVELVRFGTNAVYKLEPLQIAVRVSRPGAPPEWTERELAVTKWLSQRGFPTVAPLESVSQGAEVYGSLVTFWPWLEHNEENPSPDLFGKLLRQLHNLTEFYSEPLPPWNPAVIIEMLLAHLRQSNHLAPSDLDLLRRWHNWLAPQLDDQSSELGTGLVHGDAHIGNCVSSDRGLLLLDFDYVCHGPREWDLIPETLGPRRFGRSRQDYQDFADAYGYDVTAWPGYRICALTRELLITCWRLDVEAISPVRAEGERRLRYWRREPTPPGWKAF